jgi:pimeloyl-ACP methyl ester carboxylesterase
MFEFRANRIASMLGALTTLVLVLAGCAPQAAPDLSQTPTPMIDATISSDLKPYYEQSLDWRKCSTVVFCTNVVVPMDWNNPTGSTIRLALDFKPASSGKAVGSLIYNPGGPGASGYDFLLESPEYIGSDLIRSKFNMVSFDPRGVQHSKPKISCLTAPEMDHLLYDDSKTKIGSPEYVAEQRAVWRDFANKCQSNTGQLLEFVDSVSVAKDLDVIRALMGDKTINYLGFSYGTLIGELYASLFPAKVGRMVLDGAVDPTAPDEEANLAQLVGFDKALRAFMKNCLTASDCPFSGSVDDAMKALAGFLYDLESKPINTSLDGRKLTSSAALTGLIYPLYDEAAWPNLATAFQTAFDGDGTQLLDFADGYNERTPEGKYLSNSTEVNIAVNCLDSRSRADAKSLASQNAKVLKASPTLGRYWQNGALGCADWPYPVVKKPKNISAKGSEQILVVGTTGDPATPYSQAVNLAHNVLDDARLLTYVGEGHTAYGRSNSCVEKAVDDYLLRKVVTTEDIRC